MAVFDVTDFGAVGDGRALDDDAFRAAIRAAEAATEETAALWADVTVPSRRFRLRRPLRLSRWVRLVGRDDD